MRFHIPGLPHTITNRDYLSCAYTQKVRKLCGMLTGLGHEVFHYGCEGSEVDASEHVSVVSRAELWAAYPYAPGAFFRFDPKDAFHRMFYDRAAAAIEARRGPRDFVLCAWGWGHQPIVARLKPGMLVVESGIGYEATFAKFRVFESYAWMAHVYGLQKVERPSWYDCVIPNFFDPEEFEYRSDKDEPFLYLGRLVSRKGVDVAAQVVQAVGSRLIVAGPGTLVDAQEGLNITGDHVEHVGFADLEQRRELLARAKALFVPTYYLEPFGGVMIEAALSGTPVITTDWGVFPENVLHGVTGYRCRTFEQFCWAAQNVARIRPEDCRAWAIENFAQDRVARMYHEYFEMLADLYERGWYQIRMERGSLDWLERKPPSGAVLSDASVAERTFAAKETSAPSRNAASAASGNGVAKLGRRTGSRPRVAIWCDPGWAFGRSARALCKYAPEDVELVHLPWDRPAPEEELKNCDRLYIPTLLAVAQFRRLHPQIGPERIIAGIHGRAESFFYDFSRNHHVPTSAAEVDGPLPQIVLDRLGELAAVGVVSKELLYLYTRNGLPNVHLTRGGFDPEEFFPVARGADPARPLIALYPLDRSRLGDITSQGYDQKRMAIVDLARAELERRGANVVIRFPESRLALEEMAEFYRSGDVHLCTSHSEGGPLVGIESAACGLAQISTSVGVMPELITEGETGFFLREQEPEAIARELADHLQRLENDRALLQNMQYNAATVARAEWTWEKRAREWSDCFRARLNKIKDAAAFSVSAARSAREQPTLHVPAPRNPAALQNVQRFATFLARNGFSVFWYGEPYAGGPADCRPTDPADLHGTAAIIEASRKGQDIVLLCGAEHALLHATLQDRVPRVELVCENKQSFANFRMFDSYWRMQYVYGLTKQTNGGWYDCVLPPAFDPDDFPGERQREDFLLYCDPSEDGLHVAAEIAETTHNRLVISVAPERAASLQRDFAGKQGIAVESVKGDVARRTLLSRAKALLLPSTEMAGGALAVEAAFAGTPVLCTDWGGYAEYVVHSVTGFRCRTLDQFRRAEIRVTQLSSADCRAFALANFTETRALERCREYFQMLADLYRKGWYELRPQRTELDWLRRSVPSVLPARAAKAHFRGLARASEA